MGMGWDGTEVAETGEGMGTGEVWTGWGLGTCMVFMGMVGNEVQFLSPCRPVH